MGAVQSAYGYAKDLDAALNDIRIVTGASAAEMDKFAVKANQAAKALSTSTTEYAKASLIYFQQGLGDSQVAERAEITIKMANAAGQSAEIISDQLTAVWNNFYDGSQSLEHYADAMVRLGADTASSSDEIAAGLEKFAAIGPMIGLGFDEAAAALATVTAQTRQSADVVGTAYKTIFARIQGLNLGETLDDGTTLNKYSEALAKVGINIKDQFGGIKDMNDILDEMGAKWNTISKDQQIALAQAVGGVRQYNQIVALMDNYDIYKENLDAAKNSDGSLDVQAQIYAESWEAAEARVQAAAEGVYDSLLNEDFFIGFNDGLATLLSGVEGLVDGLGGMTGVIATIGSLIARHFAKEAPAALKTLRDNVNGLLGKETKEAEKTQKDNNDIMNNIDTTNPANRSLNANVEAAQTLNRMTEELNRNQAKLSEEERKAYQAKIDAVEATYDLITAEAAELEQAEKKTAELEAQLIKQSAQKKLMEESQRQAKEAVGEKQEGESQEAYNKRVGDKTKEIMAGKPDDARGRIEVHDGSVRDELDVDRR
jgi:TP901 family phage tail tape measure protein